MKVFQNRLFIIFIFFTGSILAVLGIVLGQLFPFYLEKFFEFHNIYFTDGQMKTIEIQLGIIVTVLLILTFLMLVYVFHNLISDFVDPIESVTNTANELAKGNYRARVYTSGSLTTRKLRHAMNDLARKLQDIEKERKLEEERLKTLIENMGSALMMIDREGTVSIVNKKFLDTFHLTLQDIEGKNFLTVGLPEKLESFIDYVFLTESPYTKQLEIQVQHDKFYIQSYGAPVVGEYGRWLGVVIVIQDISELVRLEQIRKDFVANVSHELRTPITSIKGFSETLLDGAYMDQKMLLSFLEIIHKESNRIQLLINDLLELSKIERFGFSIDFIPTSMQEVIKRSIELTYPRITEKQMDLQVEMNSDVIVNGDANRLIQIMTNLISNAITYSPSETTITIRVYENDGDGVVEIEDQGIGIEKSEISRIFERFYRVDKARSRNSGGTGLGLAIVKHLVEAHQGKIQVESEVGKGTCMKVMIPLAKNLQ